MLEGISQNISKLIALYEEEKQRADSLSVMIASLESQNRMYKKQITDLNLQIDNLRLMSAFMAVSQQDKQKAKESISKLIREIDKCIKLLEN